MSTRSLLIQRPTECFSRQLTVQELSTIMRLGLKPIISVLNNNGYTTERFLHGPTGSFNDIVNWCDHTDSGMVVS